MSRILIKTIPYKKITLDEVATNWPGIEIELDADKKVARIYKMDGCKDPVEKMFLSRSRVEG